MKAKVIKTENGWEPAFFNANTLEYQDGRYVDVGPQWTVEPGFAKPTKAEAQAALDRDLQMDAAICASERTYQSGYDYACGYYD